MIALRVFVALLAAAGVLTVLASVLRTLVLPRAVPARLARLREMNSRQVPLAPVECAKCANNQADGL